MPCSPETFIMQHIAKNPSRTIDPSQGVYWISLCGWRLHYRDGWKGNNGLSNEAKTITKNAPWIKRRNCQRIAYS